MTDQMNLKHLMVDVKAQGEACFSSWFLPLAGWPCFSIKVYILSLISLADKRGCFDKPVSFHQLFHPLQIELSPAPPCPISIHAELSSI